MTCRIVEYCKTEIVLDAVILTNNADYVNWTNNYSNNSTKIRTITEKMFFDRTASEILPINNNGTVTMASGYNPPINTSAERMLQLLIQVM